ncbi:MAG: winged helix-turn-helix transcriptional regulator [Hadesarchaea archaeon]|nr:winged helix-turn-helix transcriptional regulator [Hadesarchaea archaeon]
MVGLDPEMIEEVSENLSETFKVLGDQTRIKILWALRKDELCVQDLSSKLEMTQSSISHQLRILRNARIVKFRNEGRRKYYSLDDEHIEGLLDLAIEHVEE